MKNIRPYLAMLVASAMIMTSFATPSMTYAEEPVVETVSSELALSSADETEVETETLEETSEDIEETVEETPEDAIVETEWSVYIYLCGSDLESASGFASDNLEALLKAPKSDNVRYIVQTGGANAWRNENIDASRCQRFVIQGSEMTPVYDEPMINMADSGNLSDFIKWGRENYPSDKSMLVFWNHGAAIRGVCWGEPYNDHLSVPDIANELKESNETFDIIGFDACLMSDFDVLYALAPYADYFVASQETEPGCGWDYLNVATYLAGNPSCSSKQLGSKICDFYVDNLKNTGITSTSTLSVIEADKLEAVKMAVDHMMGAAAGYIADTTAFSTILLLAYQTKHYAYTFEKDLVCLADNLGIVLGDEIAYEVREAVMDAVCYRAQMDEGKYNNGINLFWMPQASIGNLNAYSKFAASEEYLRLIDAIKHEWHGSMELYSESERLPEIDPDVYALKYQIKQSYAPVDSLEITNGLDTVESISYLIGSETDDGYVIQIARKGNLDIKSGNIFTPSFNGKIATVNGIPIVLDVTSETRDYILYDVPVYLCDEESNNDFLCQLRVAFYPEKADEDVKENVTWAGDFDNEENGTFTILGLYNMGSSGSDYVFRDVEPLQNGMKLAPAYPEKNEANEYFYRKGDSFVYSSRNTKVELTPLDDGEYYISYRIDTSLGNSCVTDSQKVILEKGILKKYIDKDAKPVVKSSVDKIELMHIPCVNYDTFYKDKETEEDTENTSKVTVFMYLDGADLEGEGYSSGLINSMINAKESEDVNLILETGGCENWKNDAIKNNTIQRFEVHEGTLVEVETLPNANFATEYTLEDFLKWGVSNYPAEKYIFMTYDHGGAWRGNSVDFKYDKSVISLDEIATALKNSGVHYDALYFDCCLMACAEVCAALAPYADYLIASEECMYACPDMDQSEVFSYIARHAGDFDAAKFGKYVVNDIIDGIGDELTGYELYDFQQMSLIDLSQMEDVVEAINHFGSEMLELKDEPKKLSKLLLALDDTRGFGYTYQRDIADLVNHAGLISEDTVNEVINAVNSAVVFSRATGDYSRSCGLSMCYTTDGDIDFDKYAEICPYKDYLAFLDSITLNWHAYPGIYSSETDSTSVNPLDYKPEYEAVSINDKVSGVEISDHYKVTLGISYSISRPDPDGYRFYDICKMNNFYVDSEVDKTFIPYFDGRVLTLGGADCYASVYKVQENSIVYSIPAISNNEDIILLVECVPNGPMREDDSVILNYDLDNCSFNILGAMLNDDMNTGIPSRDAMKLSDGDEITLLTIQSDANGNVVYRRNGETITYSDDISIQIKNLPDGEYRLNYEITGGLMQTERSADVKVIIANGRIQQEIVPESESETESESESLEEETEDEDDEDEDDEDDEDDEQQFDISALKYNTDAEDASVVYLMEDVSLEEAKALTEEGMLLTLFEADQNLGFYGATAASCIDFEKLYDDYIENQDESTEPEESEEPEETEETETAEDTEKTAFVNVIDGFGMLVSNDPVALDQACLDIVCQLEGGSEFLYNVLDCHGIELLEEAESIGCGMRHYKLEFIDSEAE